MKKKLGVSIVMSLAEVLLLSWLPLAQTKPKIAVFSGPNATMQNNPQLVTSNKARILRGLPPRTHPDGSLNSI